MIVRSFPEEETLQKNAVLLPSEGGDYRCWERLSWQLRAEWFGASPARQLGTSSTVKLRENGSVCPAVVAGPRRDHLFYILWYLGIGSSPSCRETEEMPLFFVSNYFSLIFFYFFFGILYQKAYIFCAIIWGWSSVNFHCSGSGAVSRLFFLTRWENPLRESRLRRQD